MAQKEWKEIFSSLREEVSADGGGVERAHSSLKLLVRLSLDIQNRRDVTEEDIKTIASILELYSTPHVQTAPAYPAHANTTPTCPAHVHVCTEALKLLRNLCVELPGNQAFIISQTDALPQAGRLVAQWTVVEGVAVVEDVAVGVTRAALQLMANSCVRQTSGQRIVWKLCFPHLFRTVLGACGGCHDDMICMLLHYCTLDNATHREQLCTSPADILGHVIRCLATPTAWEWSSLLMEALLSSEPIRKVCPDCSKPSTQHLILLKFILQSFPSSHPEASNATPTQGLATPTSDTDDDDDDDDDVLFFAELFHNFARLLINAESALMKEAHNSPLPSRSHDHTKGEEPGVGVAKDSLGADKEAMSFHHLDFVEVRTCHVSLKILCHYASNPHHRTSLQATPTVSDDAIGLFRALCTLDESDISSRNRSHLRKAPPQEEESWHCLYGFKRDVMQLLGLLLYQCTSIQDKLREGGVVSLVLNQCGIDHRNPYIAQWAVLAIRNLCEANPANQQLIAGLRAQGVCPIDQDVLKAAGGELEVGEDGRVRIKQSKSK